MLSEGAVPVPVSWGIPSSVPSFLHSTPADSV